MFYEFDEVWKGIMTDFEVNVVCQGFLVFGVPP